MILDWLIGGGISAISKQITDWDIRRRNAENDSDRIEAETQIAFLEARTRILAEETKYAATRWIRPTFAAIVAVYWAKLIVWDTVLGWGATPYPGDHVVWMVTLVPAAYFLARPFERWRK